MKIHVTYMGPLRRLTGMAGEEVTLPEGSGVSDLLTQLAGTFARGGPALNAVLVFRGEEQVGLETRLGEADRVTLLAPMAGGSKLACGLASQATDERLSR